MIDRLYHRLLCWFDVHEWKDQHMRFEDENGNTVFLDGTLCKWCRKAA